MGSKPYMPFYCSILDDAVLLYVKVLRVTYLRKSVVSYKSGVVLTVK